MQKRKQKPAEAKDETCVRRLQVLQYQFSLNLLLESDPDATHVGCDVDLIWTQAGQDSQKTRTMVSEHACNSCLGWQTYCSMFACQAKS